MTRTDVSTVAVCDLCGRLAEWSAGREIDHNWTAYIHAHAEDVPTLHECPECQAAAVRASAFRPRLDYRDPDPIDGEGLIGFLAVMVAVALVVVLSLAIL